MRQLAAGKTTSPAPQLQITYMDIEFNDIHKVLVSAHIPRLPWNTLIWSLDLRDITNIDKNPFY